MNWLLIVIFAVVAGNVIWGFKEGFMRVALSLVSWLVVLVACYIATPIVSDFILENTPLAQVVHDTVTETINTALDEVSGGVLEALNSEKIAEVEAAIPEQIKGLIYGKDFKTLEDLVNSVGEVELDTAALAGGAARLIGLMLVLFITTFGIIFTTFCLTIFVKNTSLET